MKSVAAIIHLDGPDKSGKDTIKKELVSRSEGNYLIVNRSFLSQIVYSIIYSRNINVDFFYEKALQASKNGELFFYLRPNDLSAIKDRFEKHNETDMLFEDYEKHLKIFDQVIIKLNKLGCKYVEIDTTFYNLECCLEIIEFHTLTEN